MKRELTHGSLFSGIEGFGLGAALAGIKTEWEFPKSVFRQPYLPWELPRVYPGGRWDLPEPRTFGSTNGPPDLVDRNKCVGNAVQPLMAQYLFECIKCFDQ